MNRLAKGTIFWGVSIANQILPALVGFTERVVEAQREGNVLIRSGAVKKVFAGTAQLRMRSVKTQRSSAINAQLPEGNEAGAFGDMFKDDNKVEFLKVQLREATKELQGLVEKQTSLDRALRASDEGTNASCVNQRFC